MNNNVDILTLRSAALQDRPFLATLYRSTRDDLLQLGLPEAMAANLMQMQFESQQTGYRTQFPNADHDIVEKNGEPVGCLITHRGDGAIRLVYIAFLPHERNKGHGRRLIRALQNEAAGSNKILTLSVDPLNMRAKHLYLSAGFRVNGDDGMEMVWSDS
ncbi:MAG: GNAT family N-acetyltransferase [Burkholderiales bacterium]|nr:GNAT family N-acetyltransferase [Burkholderiales bacterium]